MATMTLKQRRERVEKLPPDVRRLLQCKQFTATVALMLPTPPDTMPKQETGGRKK